MTARPCQEFKLPFPHPTDRDERRVNAEFRRNEKLGRRTAGLERRKQGDRRSSSRIFADGDTEEQPISKEERKMLRKARVERRRKRYERKIKAKRAAGIMSDTSPTSSDAEPDLDTNSEDSDAPASIRHGAVYPMRRRFGGSHGGSGDPDADLARIFSGVGPAAAGLTNKQQQQEKEKSAEDLEAEADDLNMICAMLEKESAKLRDRLGMKVGERPEPMRGAANPAERVKLLQNRLVALQQEVRQLRAQESQQ